MCETSKHTHNFERTRQEGTEQDAHKRTGNSALQAPQGSVPGSLKSAASEQVAFFSQDGEANELATDWQNAVQFQHMKAVFRDAALSKLPEARIVLSYPPSPDGIKPPELSTAVELPFCIDGWKIVGVAQHTGDVDFAFSIPFLDRVVTASSQSRALQLIHCRVIYQPGSDSCVFYNMSQQPICIDNLESQERVKLNEIKGYKVLDPGYWRVSVCLSNEEDEVVQRMAELLLVERQFHVSLKQFQHTSASTKRALFESAEEPIYKRLKAVGDDAENGIQPSSFQEPQLTGQILEAGQAFIDLEDGQTALIESLSSPQSTRTDEKDVAMERYQLTRVNSIAQHPSTTVITCQHSELGDIDIVAKILRYNLDEDATQLVSCANAWTRETRLLRKLNHNNVVAQHGVDGRQLAIFLEQLPRSLSREKYTPFSREDNMRILVDVSLGLSHITSRGISHNDVKPGNIAYSPRRGAVLLDFGLAGEGMTQGVPGGTPWYMPLKYFEEDKFGPENDVWALGITMLYTLGIIPKPDEAGTYWDIHRARAEEEPDYGTMIAWIKSIKEIRKTKLEMRDPIHKIVHGMLNMNRSQRLTATQVHARAKGAASWEDAVRQELRRARQNQARAGIEES